MILSETFAPPMMAVKGRCESLRTLSIAASSLARYEGDHVISALTKAMSSEQWYVRYNAANSLKAKRLEYEDLIEVVHTGDRYAREMVMYRLLAREQEESMEGGHR